MKVPDLIASLRDGSGSKLTPEERKEIMEKLLNSEDDTEEVVLDQQNLDAHISVSTRDLFKQAAETQNPEDTAESAQQSDKPSGRFGKLGKLFRGSDTSSSTDASKKKSLTENKTIIYAVVGGVVLFLGWQGINFFLNDGYQFNDTSKVAKKKTTKSKTAAKKAKNKKTVAKATAEDSSVDIRRSLSKTSIQAALQDCTVTATTRNMLSASTGKTSQFGSKDYTLAILTIQAFQRKFQAADPNTKIQASSEKYDLTRKLLAPEIAELRTQIGQYRQVRLNRVKELAELRERERESQDGKRLQNRVVAGVNLGIRLRDEIESLEEHLQEGPQEEDLLMVESQLSALDSIVVKDGDGVNPANMKFDLIQQSTALASLSSEQLDQKLRELIKRDFDAITAAVAKSTPDLKAYQIQNTTKTITQLNGMMALLKQAPEIIFSTLNREQTRLNDKLNRLLDDSSGNWLDYTPCLKQKMTVSKVE